MRSWKRVMQLTDRVDWKYYACFQNSKMPSEIKGKPFIAALITSIHLIAFTQQSKSLNDTMPFMKLWFYTLAISFSLSNVLAQTAEGKPSGYELMTNKQYGNCIACHDMPGVQGMVSNFAPSLKGVGQRLSAQELTQWVVDARRINPDTLMPPFGSTHELNLVRPARAILTNEQIALIVSSLQSWR